MVPKAGQVIEYPAHEGRRSGIVLDRAPAPSYCGLVRDPKYGDMVGRRIERHQRFWVYSPLGEGLYDLVARYPHDQFSYLGTFTASGESAS